MKRKSDVHVTAVEDGGSEDEDLFEIEALSSTSKWPIRPIGIKMAKEHQRLRKAKEDLVRAQAKATAAMAAANLRKAQALSDQAALFLFTMPVDLTLSEQAREYLDLRREEELRKLRRRIAAEKEQEAREAAEWKRQAQENAAEVSNRVLPREGRALYLRGVIWAASAWKYRVSSAVIGRVEHLWILWTSMGLRVCLQTEIQRCSHWGL